MEPSYWTRVGAVMVLFVAALAAGFLVIDGGNGGGDEDLRTEGDHVTLTAPDVRPVRSGDLSVQATFTWDACGDQACFAFDRGRHGGPDVFGIRFDPEPELNITHATLTLRSSCGEETSLTEDPVQSSRGVFFIVQDTTRKGGDGDGCHQDFDRVYNMAAGTLEVLVDPPADCGNKNLFFTTIFGHSYDESTGDVKIDLESEDTPQVTWDDDSGDHFTSMTNEGGVFDCAGVPKG